MIGVDLRARLSDLLHDNVRLVFFDHPLDLAFDVRRNHDESVALVENSFICLWINVDLLGTSGLRALAVQRYRRADLLKIGPLLDLPVYILYKFLVARCTTSEIHAFQPFLRRQCG
jgi:hypothetical protein